MTPRTVWLMVMDDSRELIRLGVYELIVAFAGRAVNRRLGGWTANKPFDWCDISSSTGLGKDAFARSVKDRTGDIAIHDGIASSDHRDDGESIGETVESLGIARMPNWVPELFELAQQQLGINLTAAMDNGDKQISNIKIATLARRIACSPPPSLARYWFERVRWILHGGLVADVLLENFGANQGSLRASA
jgi:hypothetical protein